MSIGENDIRDIAEQHRLETGGVIIALRAVQDAFRCVPESADRIIADVYNLSRAEVRGIISFYADFTREPMAKTVIRLCVAEACQAAGSRKLQASLTKRVQDISGAEGCPDIEPIYCLGLCSAAPAAMVGEKLIGRADADRIVSGLAPISKEA
ncbi:MAG: NAD(P)H-dependent oxidoreductase subunit E [Pseudomonadota bacterium]